MILILLQLLTLLTFSETHFIRERTYQPIKELDYKKSESIYLHYSASVKSMHAIKRLNSSLVYEQTYLHNQYGFRYFSNSKKFNQSKNSHLILAGCSFIYGEGLKDEETLTYKLQDELPSVNVQSFAQQGTSTNEHLFLWDHYNFKNFIPQQKGIFVYTLIEDHISRVSNDINYLLWAIPNRPTYVKERDVWKISGKLGDSIPFKWANFINSIGLKNTWLRLISHFKPRVRTKVIDNFVSQLDHLRSLYKKQFPEGKFYVSQFNSLRTFINSEEETYLHSVLKKYKISFLKDKLKDKFLDLPSGALNIPNDGHPSALANEYYAEFLKEKLRYNFSRIKE